MDHKRNLLHGEDAHFEMKIVHPDADMKDLNPQQKAHLAHMKFHKEHAGHESQHAMMLLILIFALIVTQILLCIWKKYHFKSYQLSSTVGLLVIPFLTCIHFGWWRFVIIFCIFTFITVNYAKLAFRRHISGTTPRLIYNYFYYIHTLSAFLSIFGYLIFLLTLLGVPVLLNAPEAWADAGLLIMFYGLYYGVAGRDLADICTDRMASHIGYYSEDGLPRLKLGANVCAACGNAINNSESEEYASGPLCRPHTINDKTLTLTCKHSFHEKCLRGWCIIGKKQICPYCKEKVNLQKTFSNPWEKPHVLFGQMIDLIRYFVVWNPIIMIAVKVVFYFYDLK